MSRPSASECRFDRAIVQDDQSPDAEGQAQQATGRGTRNHGDNCGSHRERIAFEVFHFGRPDDDQDTQPDAHRSQHQVKARAKTSGERLRARRGAPCPRSHVHLHQIDQHAANLCEYAEHSSHDQGGCRGREALGRHRIGLAQAGVSGGRRATDRGCRRHGLRWIPVWGQKDCRAGPATCCSEAPAGGWRPAGSFSPGIVLSAPHSGHWACRPTVSSPVRNNLPHWLQRNSMDIAKSLLVPQPTSIDALSVRLCFSITPLPATPFVMLRPFTPAWSEAIGFDNYSRKYVDGESRNSARFLSPRSEAPASERTTCSTERPERSVFPSWSLGTGQILQ